MGRRRPAGGRDLVGVLVVIAAAGAVMTPALVHGASLGSFDLLSRYGLTHQPGAVVHNAQATDQIAEMIPWTVLSWTQVHSGHLPLWNAYNALGLPLAFNWQSSAFSIPSLLGYLAPLHLAYTVQVLTDLVLAGTGVYVLGRVMGLHLAACAMAGVVYELSGEFMGFLGWPVATVMAFAGWLLAAVVLVLQGRRRLFSVVMLAVATASMIYAGQPDALLLFALGIAVLVTVDVVVRVRRHRSWRRLARTLLDLAAGGGAGVALAAPLWLPGLQLVDNSVFLHAGPTAGAGALSPYDGVNLLFQGFNGQAAAHSPWFAAGSSVYVGVIALVLAVVGVASRVRRPEVAALAAVTVVMAVLAFVPAVSSVLGVLPFTARWHLGLLVLTFAVAVLAGVGADVVLRGPTARATHIWLAAGFLVALVIEAELWLIGRGHLPPAQARIRDESFAWPVAATAVGLVVAALVARRSSPGRRRFGMGHATVGLLFACEASFLVAVGAPVWSSSPTFVKPTAAVRILARTVGSARVGFGTSSCEVPPTLGVLPEANAVFGVRELSAYDPITPAAFFHTTLPVVRGLPKSAFCPIIRTARKARHYGVGFVLVAPGHPAPRGTSYVRTIAEEKLYRVPGAAAATVVAVHPGTTVPRAQVHRMLVSVHHPHAGVWRMNVAPRHPSVLHLRLTNVPGWHATLDGRPLALEPYDHVMLQAKLPAGRHEVVLHYWPTAFTEGLALAAAATVALASACIVTLTRRRHRRHAVGALAAAPGFSRPRTPRTGFGAAYPLPASP